MIHLDGSFGEGGGQMLRTALALSALTLKPFEISNIRKGRCTPGIKAQHLSAIKIVQALCNATVTGAKEGSEKMSFIPQEFTPKDVKIDIGTAGSVTLVLQAVLLPAIFAKKRMNIKLTGGTDVTWSMPVDYIREVVVPHLRKYAHIECNIHRRGYFPKGNGLIELDIRPKFSMSAMPETPKIRCDNREELIMVRGVSHASSELQDSKVPERQAHSAQTVLKALNCPIDIRQEYSFTQSTGSGIALFAYFGKDGELNETNPQIIGADALGEMGVSAEDIGARAAKALLLELKYPSPVDSNLADNLIPFLALTGDSFTSTKVTEHTKTNIYVVEKFLGSCIEIKESNIKRINVPQFIQEQQV